MRTLTLVATLSTLVACGSSSDPVGLEQQPASSTGMMAVVATGSRTKIYVESGANPDTLEKRLAVVDAGVPSGTSGLITFIRLEGAAAPRAAGASGTDVVVLDRDAPTIHFVDAATDTVRGSAPLPAGVEIMRSSNTGYYTSATAVDGGRRRAYVSTSLGIVQYDLDTRAHTATFASPPTESFALDTAADRIYAPFYLCDPSDPDPTACTPYPPDTGPAVTDSLSVVDVASESVFTYIDPTAVDQRAPLGLEPDAAAVDFPLGLLAVATEEPPALWLLDLAAATFDPGDPSGPACRMPGLSSPTPRFGYTMMAIDAATHLLVVGEEDAAGMVFVDLAQARAGQVRKLEVTLPATPDGRAWTSKGDPHAVAIGVVGGRSYAFVASDTLQWIARIDLAGVQEVMAGRGTFPAQVGFISVPLP